MADEKMPFWQRFFDNIWLLLILGILIPTLIYTVWGVIEIWSVGNLPVVR